MSTEEFRTAIHIAHWPGKDVPVCNRHLQQMIGVANAMGFQITWDACEETICSNCENAAKKAGKQ